ncbi:D-alanine--D-alanine ligase [Desulfocicer vacuolatum DSM 3385]|uniref:D-alanine--D-alanine ligase n=1 Tax=Desulfocicer vacuolatum DSM 3385 TaxID=1121400 RepID=A0A1W1ZRH3_9BACT|nr:D-alanine--D-alanine ligase [Desulfocicer vacuolatum]SMC50994.1 D-alanine--D-alanine ligase [Desulfocicer vacuolatum DSM 3385]
MKKIRLALLSGGDTPERDVSLNSAKQVYEALDKNKYEIYQYDPKTDLARLVDQSSSIDVALLILHGPNGEDGTVQGLLDLLKIPYQGAGVLGSALAMNKLAAKEMYIQAQIPVPEHLVIRKSMTRDAAYYVEKIGLPLVVKPVCAGSSVGMSIVREEKELTPAVQKALSFDDVVMVEAYVDGVELTCGVLGNDTLEALPVIEILPGEGFDFFDYTAKYTPGATEEICPARIEDTIRDQVQSHAMAAHKALFLKGYSRTDMILSQGRLYVLETNTIPGMTATSLYPQAAQVAGYSFSALLDRLIALAME